MNVLVVDDEELSRRTARRVLRGYEVDEAEDEASALSAVDRRVYDVAVLDVCLHGGQDQSGVQLARRLRCTGGVRAIVLTSGVSADALPTLAGTAEADARVAKGGTETRALRDCVDRCLRARREPGAAHRHETPESVQRLIEDFVQASAREDAARGERSFRLALLANAVAGPSAEPTITRSVARAVGVSAELLRQYAFVASRWPQAELHQLLTGGKAAISHLKEIAAMPLERRRWWTTRLLESPTTVRDLQREVRKESE